MKDRLFSNLDSATTEVVAAQGAVNLVHASRSNYNYIERVAYEHKTRVFSFLKWVWSRETRYRDEVRFNQGRFNEDLANANQKLNQAQQKLYIAEQAIKQEISLAQDQATYASRMESEVNNLISNNNSLQSKLSHVHVNSYNVSSQVSYIRNQKDSLAGKKVQFSQDLRELPSKTQYLNNDNIDKKVQVQSMAQQQQQASAAETQSYQQLYQKLMSLDEVKRATLAYEMITSGNTTILHILESCGFHTEKTAQMAVCKNQQQVFNYCIDKGIKFDCLVSILD